jgi:transcriptional regulator with XRE-family HTH domain
MNQSLNIGEAIRAARKQNALSQKELAEKLGLTQGTISNWEGKKELDPETITKLKTVLGNSFVADATSSTDGSSVLAAWLSRARQEARLTRGELAEKSGLSVPTIYNIEAGRAQNPRTRTMELLEKALEKKLDPEFGEAVRKASTIEGIGLFQDFDPHDEDQWPDEPGIYVFYDIAERPVYVGMASVISKRLKGYPMQFWFRRPIVESASYIPVKDEKLRRQIETILIKFLKSNAIINKQGVERED